MPGKEEHWRRGDLPHRPGPQGDGQRHRGDTPAVLSPASLVPGIFPDEVGGFLGCALPPALTSVRATGM